MAQRDPALLRFNADELVMQAVMGQIAHPVGRANPYRIGQDGVRAHAARHGRDHDQRRIGDSCVGLAADHVEPGVALHNNGREIIGARTGPISRMLTSACVGNRARVTSGPATGAIGFVTGKHGGVNHVLVDFDPETLHASQHRRPRADLRLRARSGAADFPDVERDELRAGAAAALGRVVARRRARGPCNACASRRYYRFRARQEQRSGAATSTSSCSTRRTGGDMAWKRCASAISWR